MGLCKCPKKKVTNQFCFEHKVNVCEYCMSSPTHQKVCQIVLFCHQLIDILNSVQCIVGPYLQWLDDSSYEPICSLCKQQLESQQTVVRLICFR